MQTQIFRFIFNYNIQIIRINKTKKHTLISIFNYTIIKKNLFVKLLLLKIVHKFIEL